MHHGLQVLDALALIYCITLHCTEIYCITLQTSNVNALHCVTLLYIALGDITLHQTDRPLLPRVLSNIRSVPFITAVFQ